MSVAGFPENSSLSSFRSRKDVRVLQSSSIPKSTTPIQIPGSLVLDGNSLKLRAEDYSVVTFPTIIPPFVPSNLQQVTTAGNTTTNPIVSGGIGLIATGGITVNGGTGISVNFADTTIGGSLTTQRLETDSLNVDGTILMNGGSQKLSSFIGNLNLQTVADLTILSPTVTLPVSTLFRVNGGGCNIISSTGNIISTTGDPSFITVATASKSIIIDGAVGSGPYRNFLLGNTFMSTRGAPPVASVLAGHVSALIVSPSSNMFCGSVSFRNDDLLLPYPMIRLTFPDLPSGITELLCFVSPDGNDEDFYEAKLRVNNTNFIAKTVDIQITPLFIVTYNFSYFIMVTS